MKINATGWFSDGMKDEFETEIEIYDPAGVCDTVTIPVLVKGTYYPAIRADAINPPDAEEFYIDSVTEVETGLRLLPRQYNDEKIQEAYFKENEV